MSDLPDPAALFKSADILRGSVDAAEYKHLVLGLLFVKYVSESFELRRTQLLEEISDPDKEGFVADEEERAEVLEDRDEYAADSQPLLEAPRFLMSTTAARRRS